MLLTGGKNSRMRMKVQFLLMQARFIEILQFSAKEIRSDTFLKDLVHFVQQEANLKFSVEISGFRTL